MNNGDNSSVVRAAGVYYCENLGYIWDMCIYACIYIYIYIGGEVDGEKHVLLLFTCLPISGFLDASVDISSASLLTTMLLCRLAANSTCE